MKKIVFCIIPIVVIFMGCLSAAPSVSTGSSRGSAGTLAVKADASSPGMDLDAAIKEAAAQTEGNLPGETKVALVSVASSSAQLSEYVINTLESALVGGKKLVVVDRANLDKIRAEQGFQLSGEVDDDSAKNIGKLLGAGAIITGVFTDLGDVYRLNIKAINIETATIAVSYPADIARSTRIETLLASGGEGAVGTRRTAQAGGQVPAQASEPALATNGTYTFRPRPQAYQGARTVSVYMDNVVVRNGYMTIYLRAGPQARGRDITAIIAGKDDWSRPGTLLRDLNHPDKSYTPLESGFIEGDSYHGVFLTFKDVTTTRFSLTCAGRDPRIIFDEIQLGTPD